MAEQQFVVFEKNHKLFYSGPDGQMNTSAETNDTIVIDGGWSEGGMDEWGRSIPNDVNWPSARVSARPAREVDARPGAEDGRLAHPRRAGHSSTEEAPSERHADDH